MAVEQRGGAGLTRATAGQLGRWLGFSSVKWQEGSGAEAGRQWKQRSTEGGVTLKVHSTKLKSAAGVALPRGVPKYPLRTEPYGHGSWVGEWAAHPGPRLRVSLLGNKASHTTRSLSFCHARRKMKSISAHV